MSSTKQIICHVGMPRAGSTFLQTRILPQVKNVYLTGHGAVKGPDDWFRNLHRKVVVKNPLTLDLDLEKQKLGELLESVKDPTVIYSEEAIFGSYIDTFRDHMQTTNLLKQLMPQARILMIFRRQDHWVESIFRRLVHHGHCMKFESFVNWDGSQFRPKLPTLFSVTPSVDLEALDWSIYIRNYKELFGDSNVLALPFELMRDDANEFMNRLAEFLGHEIGNIMESDKVNKSESYMACIINRFANQHLSKPRRKWVKYKGVRWIEKFHNPTKSFISPDLADAFKRRYSEANLSLSNLVGIDLQRYGYH